MRSATRKRYQKYRPKAKTRRRLRQMVFEAHGYVCWLCDREIDPGAPESTPYAPTLDHVIPVAEGGRWTLENLRPAHFGCNQARSL